MQVGRYRYLEKAVTGYANSRVSHQVTGRSSIKEIANYLCSKNSACKEGNIATQSAKFGKLQKCCVWAKKTARYYARVLRYIARQTTCNNQIYASFIPLCLSNIAFRLCHVQLFIFFNNSSSCDSQILNIVHITVSYFVGDKRTLLFDVLIINTLAIARFRP